MLKLFEQDEAALVAVAHLLEAAIVVLGDVEQVLADVARQLFNRTIVAIWNDRRDVHSMLIPFRSIIHVSEGKRRSDDVNHAPDATYDGIRYCLCQ